VRLFRFIRLELEGMDFVILTLVTAMTAMGLLMLYSASYIYAQERFADGYWFIKRQLAFAVVGFAAMIGAYQIDSRFWLKWRLPVLVGALGLLVIVLVPGVGVRVGGAQRWLRLWLVNFQPAEIAKYAVILFVSGHLFRKRDRLHTLTSGLLASLLFVLPVLVLLLAQPDFGSSVMIATVVYCMLFLAGSSLRWLLVSAVGAIGAAVALVLAAPYRMARLLTFMNPWEDPYGKGFQILQSMVGFHQGKLLGVGLGNGKEKLFYLPEAHSDFIFAVIGEELGFVGVIGVLLAFLFFIYRGLVISRRVQTEQHDLFGASLAAGITLILGFQGLINMAVVMGLLPTKGLALPFISYGGSGLVINLFAVGVLLNIAKSTRSARDKSVISL
jgi:cell division protein FtsW